MKRSLLISLAFLLTGAGAASGQASSNFYAVDTIQEIRIAFEQNNWRYILDSLRYNGDDMLLADLEINGKVFRDVGVRYRDSRGFRPGQSRNGLYIDLDFINTAQEYQGHRSVNLSAAVRDPSGLREVLACEVARQYMPAPQANFARVRINNDYYGLFVNVEPVDAAFLERHFGSGNGGLFFSQPRPEETEPEGCRSDVDGTLQFDGKARCYLRNFAMLSGNGWDDLIELTRILDKEPEKIAGVLDTDNALWMLAFNNLVVNLNSYTGQSSPNYYLYHRPDGRFTPLLWDLNLSFGSFKNTGVGSDLRIQALEQLDPMLHMDNQAKPLIHHLLANEQYRKIYLAHLRTIMRDQFDKGTFEQRALQLQALIRPSVLMDSNRGYSEDQFTRSLGEMIGDRSQIPGILTFMKNRVEFLKHHSSMTVVPPDVESVEVERRQKFSSTVINDFRIRAKVGKMPRRVLVYYRFDRSSPYMEARLYDDGAHNDAEANDGIFGAAVTPPKGQRDIEYYIFSESAGAVSFYPQRYMFEPLKGNLDEINK